MSVNLNGKYIPMEYFKEYNGTIRPDEQRKISPSGEEVMPKDFPFRFVLDRFSNAYLIPIIGKNDPDDKIEYEIAYNITDIIEAASGDKNKQQMIEECHNKLKDYYQNHHVMEDNFQQAFYETVKPFFEKDYKNVFGKNPKLPEQITTHRNMSSNTINLLCSEAKIAKNN